ncbi:MAG: tetratricopeptide repeat protein [Kouleothrix sp.]
MRARRTIDYYRERCKPPLTQLGLAQALDKHVNTIQYWERHGVSRPANLLALAALFVERGALADYETALRFWETNTTTAIAPPPELARLFTAGAAPFLSTHPANASALPDGSLMPLRPNPLFVGREAELQLLALAWNTSDTVAITGLGGIGKTQLAAQFVHSHSQYFPGGVFWISFADPHTIPVEVAACGLAGRLDAGSGFYTLPLEEKVRLVQRAWQSNMRRLLIFDNCEEGALLLHWRPTTGGCCVLLTSRRTAWSPALGIRTLPLAPLPRAESVSLLRRQAAQADEAELQAIAAELGDLPLALHMAANVLARYQGILTPANYLAQVRAQPMQLHPLPLPPDISPTGHELSVERTFAVSYWQLREGDPTDCLARELLHQAACFAPGEPIPHELLLACAGYASDALPVRLLARDALMRLVGELGLLEENTDTTLRMHRLVASFIHACVDTTLARAAVEQALIAETNQRNERRLPHELLELQGHLRAVTDTACQRGDVKAAELCAVLGWQLVLLGAFRVAQYYLEQASAIRKALFPGDHIANIDSLGLLGLLHQFQGYFVQAQPYYEQALGMSMRLVGPDHAETGTCHNNLGYLLFHLGYFDQAQQHLRNALRIQKPISGLCHGSTARILNNLGYTLLHCGKLAAARRYLKLALAIREQLLPRDNPATAQTLNNLGEVLFLQADYGMAQHYHQRALAMREELVGVDNFDTAESLCNVSRVYAARGNYTDAACLLDRAIVICENTRGKVDPMSSTIFGPVFSVGASCHRSKRLITCRGAGAAAPAGACALPARKNFWCRPPYPR